jgi:hypothetical protein
VVVDDGGREGLVGHVEYSFNLWKTSRGKEKGFGFCSVLFLIFVCSLESWQILLVL